MATIFSTILATTGGISALYEMGSYPEGEMIVNGQSRLIYSPLIGKDGFPVPADHYARGLYKVQTETSNVAKMALFTSIMTQLLASRLKISPWKKWPLQLGLPALATTTYGCYRGDKTIMK
jgi:hypothetical protein